MFPTVMDPPGIHMLESIREILKTIEIDLENVNLECEIFETFERIIEEIKSNHKCPIIIASKIHHHQEESEPEIIDHAVVATGIKTVSSGTRQEFQLVQCKNSDPDNADEGILYENRIV